MDVKGDSSAQLEQLGRYPSFTFGMVWAMVKTSAFSTASPLAFDDPESEVEWNTGYMRGVAKRLSCGTRLLAGVSVSAHLVSILNHRDGWLLHASSAGVVFIALSCISVSARKHKDIDTKGIGALFMATAFILAASTTITQWVLWSQYNATLVLEGASDKALSGWAQANSAELAWFYTLLVLLCVAGIHTNFRMAFNLSCMSVFACAVSSFCLFHAHLSLGSIALRSIGFLGGSVVVISAGAYRAERQDRRHFLERTLLVEKSCLLKELSSQKWLEERRVIEAESRADAEHNVVALLCHEIR